MSESLDDNLEHKSPPEEENVEESSDQEETPRKKKRRKKRYRKHSHSRSRRKAEEEKRKKRKKERLFKKLSGFYKFSSFIGCPFVIYALYETINPLSEITEEEHFAYIIIGFVLIFTSFLYKKTRFNMILLLITAVTFFLIFRKVLQGII